MLSAKYLIFKPFTMKKIKIFNTIIETERLILRPFNLEDVAPSYKMNLDPEITRFTNDGGIKTKTEIYQTIKENVLGDYKKHGFGRFAVILKKENKFIGFSGIKYLPEYNLVDIGFRFIKEYWGTGIATESGKASLKFAFTNLKLKKVYGFVLPENKASIRVLEKLKFTFEKDFFEEEILINQYVIKAK